MKKSLYLSFIVPLCLLNLAFNEIQAQETGKRTLNELQINQAWNSFLDRNYQSASNACNIILKSNRGATPEDLVKTNYIKSASELYLGNYFQASFYYQLANRIRLLNKIEYPEIDRLYQLNGEIKLYSGNSTDALTAFRKTKETVENKLKVEQDETQQSFLKQRLALCLTFIGNIYCSDKEFSTDRALSHFQQAEELLTTLKSGKRYRIKTALQKEVDWSLSVLYSNYANYYQAVGQDLKAIDYLEKGRAMATEKGFKELKLTAGNQLGALYQKTDTLEAARKIYLENLEQIGHSDDVSRAHKQTQINLMRLLLEEGQLDSLAILLDDYDEVNPIINDSLEIASAKAIERFLANEIEEKLAVSERNDFLKIGITGALLVGLLLAVLYFLLRTKNRQLRKTQEKLSASQLDLQQKNEALEKSLQDLVLSKREMNHRVKNTLQLIGSIIMSYQREDEVKQNEVSSRVLRETRNKIETILLLHNQLSGRRNNGEINLQEYLNNLGNYLKKTLLYTDANFIANIDVASIPPLHLEKAQNIGLAITELAINSYKYSPAEDKWLKVSATLPEEGLLHLIVEDNGTELAKKSISTSLGLKIIREIIKRQFKGEFIDPDGTSGKHTKFEVKIPVESLT